MDVPLDFSKQEVRWLKSLGEQGLLEVTVTANDLAGALNISFGESQHLADQFRACSLIGIGPDGGLVLKPDGLELLRRLNQV